MLASCNAQRVASEENVNFDVFRIKISVKLSRASETT